MQNNGEDLFFLVVNIFKPIILPKLPNFMFGDVFFLETGLPFEVATFHFGYHIWDSFLGPQNLTSQVAHPSNNIQVHCADSIRSISCQVLGTTLRFSFF